MKTYQVSFCLIVPAETTEEATNGFTEYIAERLRTDIEGFSEADLDIKEIQK